MVKVFAQIFKADVHFVLIPQRRNAIEAVWLRIIVAAACANQISAHNVVKGGGSHRSGSPASEPLSPASEPSSSELSIDSVPFSSESTRSLLTTWSTVGGSHRSGSPASLPSSPESELELEDDDDDELELEDDDEELEDDDVELEVDDGLGASTDSCGNGTSLLVVFFRLCFGLRRLDLRVSMPSSER